MSFTTAAEARAIAVHVHPKLRALRCDDAPQRQAQAHLIALAERWKARPGNRAVIEAVEAFAAGRPLVECPALDALFAAGSDSARIFVGGLVEAMAAGLRDQPLGHIPFRHFHENVIAVLQLARAGNVTLSLVGYDGAAMARRPEPVTVDFAPIDTRDQVLAGTARADFIECRHHDNSRAELVARQLALRPGMVITREASRQAMQLRSVDGCLVALRLQRRVAGAGATREYALADGSLVHLAAGNPNDSRRELMMALLGRMGRADAAPLLADIAREQGSDALRWQALRESLALDTASGFAALVAIARSSDDPLAPAAGALRAQLVETWPQLAEIEPCPM